MQVCKYAFAHFRANIAVIQLMPGRKYNCLIISVHRFVFPDTGLYNSYFITRIRAKPVILHTTFEVLSFN